MGNGFIKRLIHNKMKKTVFAISMSVCFTAFGQNATINTTSNPTTYNLNRGALSALQYVQIPRRTLNVPFKNVDSTGNMQIDPIDNNMAYFSGSQWKKVVSQDQLNSMLNMYLPVSMFNFSGLPGVPSSFPPAPHTHQISDVTDLQIQLSGKEDSFAKNTAFNKGFGTTSGTVAEGSDSRIINGQTAFGWGNHAFAGYLTSINSSMISAALGYTPVNPSSVPDAQVPADWNSASGVTRILNKPTLGTASAANTSDFATASQGALAVTALQPNGNGSALNGITKSQIGLNNVDNTSDANKPISTATQSALDAKQGSITLTTTGNSGAATFSGNTINIPVYSTVNVASDSREAHGTGTAYSLTTTSAKVTMGTTSPVVTLPASGTYLLLSNLKMDYAGLTTIGISTSTFKLRRINNTAADIPNAGTTFTTPILTLTTGPAGDVDMQGTIYTTSTSGDVIEMWGNRGSNISVGNINVSEAWIVAIRLY
jgi:hypothetical protein